MKHRLKFRFNDVKHTQKKSTPTPFNTDRKSAKDEQVNSLAQKRCLELVHTGRDGQVPSSNMTDILLKALLHHTSFINLPVHGKGNE